jgi:type IV pilus assembly protein PilE
MHTRRQAAGFTLIELMIVVVVIAILTAIAYPSYTKYLMRSHRSAAQGYLMDLAQREQQYLLDNRGYADTTALIALDAPTAQVAADYTVSVKNLVNTGTPPTFEIWAEPIAGSMPARFSDPTLKIFSSGYKDPPYLWQ